MYWASFFVLSLALFCGSLTLLSSYIKQNLCSKYLQNKVSLLVIAHPDDEAMFFGPLLLNIADCEPSKTYLLSLSNGNYDGLGYIREKELLNVASSFGIPKNNVKIINDSRLQDGMNQSWNRQYIAEIVSNIINLKNISLVISFDKDGISSHPNHQDVYHGISSIYKDLSKNNSTFITLTSVSLFRKYLSFFDIPLTLIDYSLQVSHLLVTLSFSDYTRLVKVLLNHRSQMVWFRWLYAIFSRYMFINTFNYNFIPSEKLTEHRAWLQQSFLEKIF